MMGRLSFVVVALFFVCVLCVVLGSAESGTEKAQTGGITALPPSLDELYPPKAPGPVLLQSMHGLNAALAGIVVDISENDRRGAVANFERLKMQYRDNARLVPEWESLYPAEPLEELGKIVSSGAPPDIMAAVGKVGAVCHDCHLATMVPVQQRYRWPDFRTITVHDPVINADLDYPAFMQMLNASLIGVGMNIEEGQPENASAQLAALRSRMSTLKESCEACHDTERTYFVDERIELLLANMEEALDSAASGPAILAQLSQRIGEESCSRCHLVHLPAAYSGYALR